MRRLAALVLLAVAGGAAPAHAADAGCTPAPDLRQGPRLVHARPPAKLTAALGALRRPATPADRLPVEVRRELLSGGAATIDVDYVRQIGQTPFGEHVFLVPGTRAIPRLSKRCLARLPRRQRRFAEQELARLRKRGPAILDETLVTDDGRGTQSTDVRVGDLRSGGIIEATPSAFRAATDITGLVPDGVAQVVATAPDGTQSSATVTDNFLYVELPVALHRATVRLAWRRADGSLIKTVPLLAL